MGLVLYTKVEFKSQEVTPNYSVLRRCPSRPASSAQLSKQAPETERTPCLCVKVNKPESNWYRTQVSMKAVHSQYI